MKYMVIIASVVVLALANPANRRFVNPGAAGPAPIPEPIASGPAILDFEPISIGPAPVEHVPIGVAPTPVFPDEGISVPVAPIAPAPIPLVASLIKIVVNVNAGQGSPPQTVPPTIPVAPAPENPDVVETAPAPDIGDPVIVVPQPIDIGVPVLPSPEDAPEPVLIGNPVLPIPAVVLPEELN